MIRIVIREYASGAQVVTRRRVADEATTAESALAKAIRMAQPVAQDLAGPKRDSVGRRGL